MIARRLANQFLTGTPLAAPHAVVEALGAVQAQDYGGAKWAIAQRTRGATDADVEAALDDGRLIRTHVLRPTWHIVPAADVHWMLELTAPRVQARMATYDRRLGLDAATFARSGQALRRALEGGAAFTRAEVVEVLAGAGVAIGGTVQLAHIMMQAELDGIVCSGPRRGKQSTYALLDERVPHPRRPSRDEALRTLATTYFTTRGPATLHDFVWWSGLTMVDARRATEMLGDALTVEAIDGKQYWSGVGRRTSRPRSPHARLLSNYDEYFIAYKDRSALSPVPVRRQWAPGLNDHMLAIDGRLIGRWTRTLARREVTVGVQSMRRLTKSERSAVDEQAQRLGAFLGLPARVRFA